MQDNRRTLAQNRAEAGPEQLLSTEEVAALWGTSPRHIRRLWQERQLGGVKLGRRVRFRPVDLAAYVARQARGGAV